MGCERLKCFGLFATFFVCLTSLPVNYFSRGEKQLLGSLTATLNIYHIIHLPHIDF